MEALTPVMMVDMVSTVVIPGDRTPHGEHCGDTWGQEGIPPYLTGSGRGVGEGPSYLAGPWQHGGGFLPSGTLAGTARRSIQKDTQESITIKVAGK